MRSPKVLVALLLVACTTDHEDEVPAVQVGIASLMETVTSNRAALGGDSAWRIDSIPFIDIGASESTGPYEFNSVSGVLRLSGGGVVMANRGSGELRLFDSTGKFIKSAGRKGGGPGEFRFLTALRRGAGDTLFAVDPVLRRVTRYTGTLALGRVETFPEASTGTVYPIGWFANGSMLGATPPRSGDMQNTPARNDTAVVYRIDGTASFTEVAKYLGPPRLRLSSVGSIDIGFYATTELAVGADRAYIGYPATYYIAVYTLDGKLERIIARNVTRTLAASAADEYRTRMIALRADNRHAPQPPGVDPVEWRTKVAAEHPFAESLPAFGPMLVDASGDLWVSAYSVERDYPRARDDFVSSSPTLWTVFSRGGRWICDVTTPARFQPFDIGTDYVAGVWRDENDVERVRVYRLRRVVS